jgi:surfeit locus 1 family protein
MRPQNVIAALAVLFGTGVCVRLGFWQISRLHEKQAMNAALRAAIAAPALDAGGRFVPFGDLAGRRVRYAGRFDESRQVLLSGRAQKGSPGVHVVTPFRLANDSMAVLVDRGWLYSADAATARPQEDPEPPGRAIEGIPSPIELHVNATPWFAIERDSVALWSTRVLARDSLAPRFPYALAPYVVRELPGPGVPATPLRTPPEPRDEFMHVSYAIQWFLFGGILLFGSLLLARSRRRPTAVVAPGRTTLD